MKVIEGFITKKIVPCHMARLKTCGKPSVSDHGRFFVFRKVVCRNQPRKPLGWFLFTRLG